MAPAPKKNSRLGGPKTKVAAAAIALVGGFEGLRLAAYPDPASKGHPWTICYGHTADVRRGDRKDIETCKALLISDLSIYANGVESCIKRPMTDGQFVAYTSLAFNIGTGAFCKSSIPVRHNAGDIKGACGTIMAFNKARVAGVLVTFPGLTRRRQAEWTLCAKDLPL